MNTQNNELPNLSKPLFRKKNGVRVYSPSVGAYKHDERYMRSFEEGSQIVTHPLLCHDLGVCSCMTALSECTNENGDPIGNAGRHKEMVDEVNDAVSRFMRCLNVINRFGIFDDLSEHNRKHLKGLSDKLNNCFPK